MCMPASSSPCLASPVTTPAAASPVWRRAPCLTNCSTFSFMSRRLILSINHNSVSQQDKVATTHKENVYGDQF